MLVLLNRLDIDSCLSELKKITITHGITKVYLASVSSVFTSRSGSTVLTRELDTEERIKVYLARVSRAFGSRIRSRVAPHKLDMAAKMSDEAANKYLSKIADFLRAEGIDAEPVSTSISVTELGKFITKNNIDLIVSDDGHSGLRRWPSESLIGRNVQSFYEDALAQAIATLERRKVKARFGLRTMTGAVLQFSALLVFWLILSGHYQLKYILFGVVSAALVTFLTNDTFSDIFHHDEIGKNSGRLAIQKTLRFLAYMPWLLYQIVKASVQVASIVLNPKMPIDPILLQFNTQLKRKVAQVILATSITLTPGTMVINLEEGTFIIHALVPETAGDLIEAKMQNKVGEIFMENKEQPPVVLWAHTIEELV
jgi:multicomponent Na+:H+ antiporter subunit E